MYEIVLYTASLPRYAVPLIQKLDPNGLISHYLFRDHCSLVSNTFVKDLSLIGRQLDRTIIIDNSPTSYILQPDNAIGIKTWVGDPLDTELIKLIPLLEVLSYAQDVRKDLRKPLKCLALRKHSSLLQPKMKLHRYVSSVFQTDEEKSKKTIVRQEANVKIKPIHLAKTILISKDMLPDTAKSFIKPNSFSNRVALKIEGHKLESSKDVNPITTLPELTSSEDKIKRMRLTLRTSEISVRDMIKNIRHVGPLIKQSTPYLTKREINTAEHKIGREFLLKYMY